jgi:hypothetical protein
VRFFFGFVPGRVFSRHSAYQPTIEREKNQLEKIVDSFCCAANMRDPDPDEDGKHGLELEEHEPDEIIGRPERVTYISESQEDFDDADIEESENGDQNALSVMDVATGMSIIVVFHSIMRVVLRAALVWTCATSIPSLLGISRSPSLDLRRIVLAQGTFIGRRWTSPRRKNKRR